MARLCNRPQSSDAEEPRHEDRPHIMHDSALTYLRETDDDASCYACARTSNRHLENVAAPRVLVFTDQDRRAHCHRSDVEQEHLDLLDARAQALSAPRLVSKPVNGT